MLINNKRMHCKQIYIFLKVVNKTNIIGVHLTKKLYFSQNFVFILLFMFILLLKFFVIICEMY